jgi:hypothetical protein
MTPDKFRAIALSFSGAVESAHMQHPDFRAHGRIFATLAYPDAKTAMVKLPVADQQRLIDAHPRIFYAAKGAWGLQGCTMVHLDAAREDLMTQALELAWVNSAAAAVKKAAKKRAGRGSLA